MGFVKSLQDIVKNMSETADFFDAEMLVVTWETRPEIIRGLLPRPLEPGKRPLVTAFVAHYPRTNFDVSYLESALFISAEFEGTPGNYCLSMPVTNDIAMAAGREMYGYPKKMAQISLEKNGNKITGWTERRGIRFMEIRADLNGKFNTEDAMQIMTENARTDGERNALSYNFKHFPAPDGKGFDYNPRLISQETILRPKKMEIGQAEIILKSSGYDPWSEVEVVRMLGAVYFVGDNSMIKGKVVAEVNPLEFAPFAFLRWDFQ